MRNFKIDDNHKVVFNYDLLKIIEKNLVKNNLKDSGKNVLLVLSVLIEKNKVEKEIEKIIKEKLT